MSDDEPLVPQGVLRGIQGIAGGNIASKEDLAEAMSVKKRMGSVPETETFHKIIIEPDPDDSSTWVVLGRYKGGMTQYEVPHPAAAIFVGEIRLVSITSKVIFHALDNDRCIEVEATEEAVYIRKQDTGG